MAKIVVLSAEEFQELPAIARAGLLDAAPEPTAYPYAAEPVVSESLTALHDGVLVDGALAGIEGAAVNTTRLIANLQRAIAELKAGAK
ncbi:hypothetical protein [Segniliparus rugosus]|uniref:Uncharacterized protein n=1 Tax=Segniliparus rugosus (strain ATCC BAA-974 / DSM 45345 / CCUG 50838 / CIP 108380 / JCM 13579 / CDC 945) TaxID=679197 RepID=E5XMU1_SEGRC|nr:hypothetical protein [Segniliparus rugosus]EFV14361.1 hypothetical protein HMPREF9336_00811 [Segniliparus rugosus ATCC BAA-974]